MSGPLRTTALRTRPTEVLAPSATTTSTVSETTTDRRWWPSLADLAAMVGLPEPDRPLPPGPPPPELHSATVLAARLSHLFR